MEDLKTIDLIRNIMEAIDPDEDSTDILQSIIEMPDDQLSIFGPLFLEEMQKSFMDPDLQITLAASLNAQGIKFEDFAESYKQAMYEIVNNDQLGLSEAKKDFFINLLSLLLTAMSETQLITKKIIGVPTEVGENGKLPSYAHAGDAGLDLFAADSYDIGPGEQVMVKTDVKVALPNGYAFLIQPRSGLSSKTKLRICNTPGLIDSGYRGEICILMENTEAKIKDLEINQYGAATGVLYGKSYHIEKGDKIAQMRLVEAPAAIMNLVDKIPNDTERGEGGFGSTGAK